MDQPREGGGGYREDVRLLVGGGGTHQSPRHQHHHSNKTKNIFRVTLMFTLVALSFLGFYHSVSPIHCVFNVTYNTLPIQSSDQSLDTSISSQDLLSTHEKLDSTTKISFDDQSDLSQARIANENLHHVSRDDGNESLSNSFSDSNGENPLHDSSSSSSFDPTSGDLHNVSTSTNSDLEQPAWNSSSISHDLDPFWTKDGVTKNVTPHTKVLGKHKGNSTSLASIDSEKEGNQMMKLKNILRKAAMPDKTVILTTLNAAWSGPGSIFDLFMESFRIGDKTKPLLKHMIIIALDQIAYSRCKEVHNYCYVLTTKGVNFTGEAAFMSKDYLALMWRRIEFLGVVLQTGYNFIFTDADVLWFRNPLPHLHKDADFQIACDFYLYNSTDKNNKPNGGFTYVKSNNRSIEFYKYWLNASKRIPGTHDQDVFNIIKNEPFFDQIGLRMRFLTTAYYGGFCQQSEDLNLVCTMHANCCVGIDHKIHDLKMLIDDWKRYMALSSEEKSSKTVSFTVPRLCGPENAKPITNLP